MTLPTFEEFRAAALSRGFDEITARSWAAEVVVPEHTHPFSVEALVVQGEMWLTTGGDTQHLKHGDRFALGFEAPHAERYGLEGATYWAARRGAPAAG